MPLIDVTQQIPLHIIQNAVLNYTSRVLNFFISTNPICNGLLTLWTSSCWIESWAQMLFWARTGLLAVGLAHPLSQYCLETSSSEKKNPAKNSDTKLELWMLSSKSDWLKIWQSRIPSFFSQTAEGSTWNSIKNQFIF